MDTPLRLQRSLIQVAGPEAQGFLQGLLTQDLAILDRAPVTYAALLSPQGKIVADMLVWKHGEGFIVDADPARGSDLMRRLSMYKLRAQVTVADVSASLATLFSPTAFESAHADPRSPDGRLGWRALAPAPAGTFEDGAAVYDTLRMAVGVPDLARDAAPEEVFALEALLEELHGVDFQKGCFVGQENVSRMKRRATTRKKFCAIAFEGPAPAPGTPILAGEAEVGSVRTGMPGRAMALLRLDRAMATPLTAEARPVRLDIPPWLILPSPNEA